MSLEVCHTRLYEKKGQNLFFTGKIAFFSRIYVSKKPLGCYRSDLLTSKVILRIACEHIQSVPWGLSYSTYEKKSKIFSSLERLPFFSKLYVFQQLLRCYRSDLITSTKIVGIPFGALQPIPWVLSPSVIREKKAKTFFSLERLPFSSKLCVFQLLLRCYRSDVITSTVIVGISFGPLQNVPWGLSHSIIREKNGKIFFWLESLPFFSKICFQQPLRFLKIWPYYFPSETQITSWTLTRCSLRFVILDNSIIWEKRPKSFFHWKDCLFFQNFVFSNNFLGVTELM